MRRTTAALAVVAIAGVTACSNATSKTEACRRATDAVKPIRDATERIGNGTATGEDAAPALKRAGAQLHAIARTTDDQTLSEALDAYATSVERYRVDLLEHRDDVTTEQEELRTAGSTIDQECSSG